VFGDESELDDHDSISTGVVEVEDEKFQGTEQVAYL